MKKIILKLWEWYQRQISDEKRIYLKDGSVVVFHGSWEDFLEVKKEKNKFEKILEKLSDF